MMVEAIEQWSDRVKHQRHRMSRMAVVADLIPLNVEQRDMKLITAKQLCSYLNQDPEQGEGPGGNPSQNTTSCMCIASVTEEGRKRIRVCGRDAGTEVWREDQVA